MNPINRKFQYGDGFFETIIYKNGVLRFWEDHWERIRHACDALRLETSSGFKQKLEEEIKAECNSDYSRVRVQFWRAEGGRYTPKSNAIEFNIEAQDGKETFIRQMERIDICETSQVIPSTFSAFKCFSLPYILAAMEKKEKALDDIILTNTDGAICEGTSSNVFWTFNNHIYTPSLSSGCLDGVMRKNIIQLLKNNSYTVIEGEFITDDLITADGVFLSNVTGISVVKYLGERELEQQTEVSQLIEKELS